MVRLTKEEENEILRKRAQRRWEARYGRVIQAERMFAQVEVLFVLFVIALWWAFFRLGALSM